MSLAFCFLTIGDLTQPRIWELFFGESDQVGIFCHPKNPQDVSSRWLKRSIIENVVQTKHGDVSLVAATLNLFRSALNKAEYEHFILVSDSTIPIISLREIQSEVRSYRSKSLISYRIPTPGSEHFLRQNSLPGRMRLKPFFFHDQWVILSREHMQKLVERPRLDWFEKMFAADEHYFLNVLAHQCKVGPDEILNLKKTFVNWREREIKELKHFDGRVLKRTIHPKTYHHINPEEVKEARHEKMWFFRKISSQCDCRALEHLVAKG